MKLKLPEADLLAEGASSYILAYPSRFKRENFHSSGFRAQELCGSRGGRSGFAVPNSPHGLCGRKTTLNFHGSGFSADRTLTGRAWK